MLEKSPRVGGHALQRVRTGVADLPIAHDEITGMHATVDLWSPAFAHEHPMPSAYTSDGIGVSPPLRWDGVPVAAASIVLLMEDADGRVPKPQVLAMAWNLPGRDGSLPVGALGDSSHRAGIAALSRNSFLTDRYFPPDPAPGHGAHRYVFQVFALDTQLDFKEAPSRAALLEAMQGHVLAKGMHIGLYQRE